MPRWAAEGKERVRGSGLERSLITAPPGNIGGIIFQRKIALLQGAGHPFRMEEDKCQKGGDSAMFTVFRAHETVTIKRWPKGVSNLRQSQGKMNTNQVELLRTAQQNREGQKSTSFYAS